MTVREANAGGGLRDKLVVVTGAGSGIGRATALRFAELGARVIAADLSLPAALETVSQGRDRGQVLHPAHVDVADRQAMESFADAVRRDHGVADIIVNNAGIGLAGPLLATTVADWERLLGVNLWGVIHGCRLFVAQMLDAGRGGHVVNVASAAAFSPSRILPAYATTKAAVVMLSECLRAELAPRGIGVTVICPGLVNTPIVRSSRHVGVEAAVERRRQERAVRLYERRNYPPERVAEHIVEAVRRNRSVVPVTVEAHAIRLVGRLFPGVARLLARLQPA